MDRLSSMSVFAKAVELGSFSAAAAALCLSGPMVGKHVRFLEERLGMTLLNRTTRRQTLTEFGKIYYDRCKVVLAEAEAADALAIEHSAEPRGRLRVTMPVHFGRRCVAPSLLALTRRHPGLEIELSFADGLVDIGNGEHDLAIRTGVLGDSTTLAARRLASQTMIVCAAPAYLAERGRPERPDDISGHDTVVYCRAGHIPPWQFQRVGQTPLDIAVWSRMRFDDLQAVADAATAGAGLAWLPGWLVRKELQDGTLVHIMPDEASFPYDVHALWPKMQFIPRRMRVAIDELAKVLPKMM